MEKEKELEPRMERFCQEFIVDLNGTEAAIRAGYTKNRKAAQVHASRLLSNAMVRKRIQTLMNKRARRVEVTSDFVLRELIRIAGADPAKAFDEVGNLKPLREIPLSLRKTISSVEVDEIFEMENGRRVFTGYTRKVKFWPKVQSLELLGKHLKLFTEKVEHSADETLAALVAGSFKEGEET